MNAKGFCIFKGAFVGDDGEQKKIFVFGNICASLCRPGLFYLLIVILNMAYLKIQAIQRLEPILFSGIDQKRRRDRINGKRSKVKKVCCNRDVQ